jgi:hypothetical protein
MFLKAFCHWISFIISQMWLFFTSPLVPKSRVFFEHCFLNILYFSFWFSQGWATPESVNSCDLELKVFTAYWGKAVSSKVPQRKCTNVLTRQVSFNSGLLSAERSAGLSRCLTKVKCKPWNFLTQQGRKPCQFFKWLSETVLTLPIFNGYRDIWAHL